MWDPLHEVLLARLRAADHIDWSCVIVDPSSIRAVGAGQKQDRTPPIALAQTPSTTSSPTRKAFRCGSEAKTVYNTRLVGVSRSGRARLEALRTLSRPRANRLTVPGSGTAGGWGVESSAVKPMF